MDYLAIFFISLVFGYGIMSVAMDAYDDEDVIWVTIILAVLITLGVFLING